MRIGIFLGVLTFAVGGVLFWFFGSGPKLGEPAAANKMEIIELKNHPFFVGTQFHPEFKSRPLAPHPLYRAFIAAAIKKEK